MENTMNTVTFIDVDVEAMVQETMNTMEGNAKDLAQYCVEWVNNTMLMKILNASSKDAYEMMFDSLNNFLINNWFTKTKLCEDIKAKLIKSNEDIKAAAKDENSTVLDKVKYYFMLLVKGFIAAIKRIAKFTLDVASIVLVHGGRVATFAIKEGVNVVASLGKAFYYDFMTIKMGKETK